MSKRDAQMIQTVLLASLLSMATVNKLTFILILPSPDGASLNLLMFHVQALGQGAVLHQNETPNLKCAKSTLGAPWRMIKWLSK